MPHKYGQKKITTFLPDLEHGLSFKRFPTIFESFLFSTSIHLGRYNAAWEMTPTAPLKQAYKQWKQQKHINKQKHGSLFAGITQSR